MALDFEALDILREPQRQTDEVEPKEKEILTPALERELKQDRAIKDKTAEILKKYQEAVKNTELLQADILKGVKANEDITQLFLKTALALSLAINNSLFYEEVAETVYTNTGIVMKGKN